MSTFFRAALLSLALVAQALPARSEVIDLACTKIGDGPVDNVRRTFDTDRRIVTTINTNGKVFEDPITLLSEQFIKWTDQVEENDVVGVNGIVDRVAGTMTFETVKRGTPSSKLVFACRRATKKF